MSDKKLCPISFIETAITDGDICDCLEGRCALYDEARQCCGLIQAPAVHHHYHTMVDWGKGKDSTGLCSSSSDPLPDKPIATLHDDGTISGEWAGGTIVGGWSRGADDKKGGANDE